jgi:hypothetical protein
MVKDSMGNYGCLTQTNVTRFRVTLIGECQVQALDAGTTYPITAITNNGVATVFTPLFPTTGAPVRSLLMLEGADIPTMDDVGCYPNITVSSNIRIESLASALVSKYSVVTYALGGGREGVFNITETLTSTGTYAALAPSWQAVASRSRQHCMGTLNPDNLKWYAINVASRLSELPGREYPTVVDFSFVGEEQVFSSQSTVATTPVQTGTTYQVPCNVEGSGWGGDFNVALTVITNGASGTSVYTPFEATGFAWIEAMLPPETGLATLRPQYYPEMSNWLQVVGSYPALACADSFKDYLKMAWGKVKSVGAAALAASGKVVKDVLRDVAIEQLLLGIAAL